MNPFFARHSFSDGGISSESRFRPPEANRKFNRKQTRSSTGSKPVVQPEANRKQNQKLEYTIKLLTREKTAKKYDPNPLILNKTREIKNHCSHGQF